MPRIRTTPGASTTSNTGSENSTLEEHRRQMDEHYNAAMSERGSHITASVGNPHSIHLGHPYTPMWSGATGRATGIMEMPAGMTAIPGGVFSPTGSTGQPANAASSLESLFRLGIDVANTALNVSATFMDSLMPYDDCCAQPCNCHHGCDCGCDSHDPCCCSPFGHLHECTPSVSGCG
jgi:hypothetical protein